MNHKLSALLILTSLLVGCSEPKTSTQKAASAAQPQVNNSKPAEVVSQIPSYSAETFFKTISIYGSRINHTGEYALVSSDESGIYNAYQYPLNGDQPKQLTQSTTDAIWVVDWFPADDRFLYSSDQGGNELNHVYVQSPDGTVKDLTPGENLKASFVGWHESDKWFYIASNERDAKVFDLYQYSVEDYSRTLIFENDNNYFISGIAPNGEWLGLSKPNRNTDTDLIIANVKSGKLINLSDGEKDAQVDLLDFSPDNNTLAYSTNLTGEFAQPWTYNIDSGEHKQIADLNWDVAYLVYSPSGKYRVMGVNEDASTVVTITEQASGQQVVIPNLAAGDIRGVNFSSDESVVNFLLNSDTSPSNLYTYQLGSNAPKKLTSTLADEMNEQHLVASSVVRFKSYDELEIASLLFKPKQASSTNKVPALIWIHGGPGGQSRTGYSAARQHLVNHGYAIFAVNNRGSSGYGKTFYHLDDKKHGDVDLKDIVYGKKYLQSLDWVDTDKIGLIGGSYGGYLTMAGLAFTDEFEVGINIFGVTNWVRTLKSIPPWWEAFKESLYQEMGDPATDEERHRAISPLFHASNIKAPVLIVQGANDPRVLQVESDEMVEAIRQNNVPVDYVLFDDEGHGFRNKSNRIEASQAYVNFLKKHL
ncbi:S9 family peptidase [Thalassotalea euphylliae]|uniref:S9 family peptidase n=1 Tax=Thalassotalea euphylliae TaxID=1655234 RepID=A0A3E0TTA5_9GAMM|nr:S9 family peptidase [Thalassotalea euphylliae]REL27155.1 S9 family peptidase [Thalassotalea euphylliae]